jgi:hypothetical protein
MGKDYFENKLECGCIITTWSDDWSKTGQNIKMFCPKCEIENKNIFESNLQKIIELNEKFKKEPSDFLVEEIIKIEIEILRKNKYNSYSNYCMEKILCPSCNLNIQCNNLNKHKKSLKHVNNLPEKNKNKILEAIECNKQKQSCSKIKRYVNDYHNGCMSKDECNKKIKELGFNIICK